MALFLLWIVGFFELQGLKMIDFTNLIIRET